MKTPEMKIVAIISFKTGKGGGKSNQREGGQSLETKIVGQETAKGGYYSFCKEST